MKTIGEKEIAKIESEVKRRHKNTDAKTVAIEQAVEDQRKAIEKAQAEEKRKRTNPQRARAKRPQ